VIKLFAECDVSESGPFATGIEPAAAIHVRYSPIAIEAVSR
jgi:hypothetical protein